MNKHLLLAMSLITFTSFSFALNCPDINDIRNNSLGDWQAYDSDDGKALSKNRALAFKKNVQQFILAEWVDGGKKHGAIRCYYRDHNGSNLEAYLSKESFIPKNNNQYWYPVSGYMQCAAGKEDCEFEGLKQQAKLASN